MGNVDVNGIIDNMKNPKDRTAEFDRADMEKNKVMSILAYIGILWLIPFFAAKDSKYARFNTNQGFLLFLVELVNSLVKEVLGGIPVLGIIINILYWVVAIVCLVYAILGIVNACKSKAKEIPFIGHITLIK